MVISRTLPCWILHLLFSFLLHNLWHLCVMNTKKIAPGTGWWCHVSGNAPVEMLTTALKAHGVPLFRSGSPDAINLKNGLSSQALDAERQVETGSRHFCHPVF
jgi:hypothetical protein